MKQIIAVLDLFLILYAFLLVFRALLSWTRLDPYTNPVARFLYSVTEPLLEPIRSIVPSVGMLDVSPWIAFLLIVALRYALSILASGL